MIKNKKIGGLIVFVAGLMLFFQNCGKANFQATNDQASSTSPQSIEVASVDLAWDKNPDGLTVGYKIYCGKISGVYDQVFDVGPGGPALAGPQATISELPTTSSYYFVVKAYDALGNESLASDEIVATF